MKLGLVTCCFSELILHLFFPNAFRFSECLYRRPLSIAVFAFDVERRQVENRYSRRRRCRKQLTCLLEDITSLNLAVCLTGLSV